MNRLRFLFILCIMHCPTTRFFIITAHTSTGTHCALHSIHNTPNMTVMVVGNTCTVHYAIAITQPTSQSHCIVHSIWRHCQPIAMRHRDAIGVVLLVFRFEYESCMKTTNETRISFCSFAFQLSNYIDTTISTSEEFYFVYPCADLFS